MLIYVHSSCFDAIHSEFKYKWQINFPSNVSVSFFKISAVRNEISDTSLQVDLFDFYDFVSLSLGCLFMPLIQIRIKNFWTVKVMWDFFEQKNSCLTLIYVCIWTFCYRFTFSAWNCILKSECWPIKPIQSKSICTFICRSNHAKSRTDINWLMFVL